MALSPFQPAFCQAGGTRACALQDWSLRRALSFVEAQRPGVSPNAGFMARLGALEERLRGCQSVRVRRCRHQRPSRPP